MIIKQMKTFGSFNCLQKIFIGIILAKSLKKENNYLVRSNKNNIMLFLCEEEIKSNQCILLSEPIFLRFPDF